MDYHNGADHPPMCIYCGTIIRPDNYDFMCLNCIDKLRERQSKSKFEWIGRPVERMDKK